MACAHPLVPDWKWIIEWISPKEAHMTGIEEVYYIGATKYQRVAIVRTATYGKALYLDGFIQSSERDERIYHEALVHPAMVTHGKPRRVAIIGGGEGATAREVLRHGTVERAVMVDIDEELVSLCRRYMPEWSRGAFDDPRLELVFDDGRRFMERTDEVFDVVIVDSVDPVEGTLSIGLYTKEFYEVVKERLGDDGVLVTQATSTRYYPHAFAMIYNTLRAVFPVARVYHTYIPSFLSDWAFVIASRGRDPASVPPEEIADIVGGLGELFFYDGEAHLHMFWVPKYLKAEMSKHKAVSTDKAPLALPPL